MDDISRALNPPRFVKGRNPIRLTRSASQVWPLPVINGRDPVVLGTTSAERRGIELAYARIVSDDAIVAWPPRSPNGTETHLMPAMTPALSIDDGVITYAGRLGHGYGMIIDHGNGWASHYANLEALCAIRTDLYCPRDQRVRAGDAIGYVGAPAPGAFKRLYFELWQSNHEKHMMPVDPQTHLIAWKLVHHHDHVTPRAPSAAEKKAA